MRPMPDGVQALDDVPHRAAAQPDVMFGLEPALHCRQRRAQVRTDIGRKRRFLNGRQLAPIMAAHHAGACLAGSPAPGQRPAGILFGHVPYLAPD